MYIRYFKFIYKRELIIIFNDVFLINLNSKKQLSVEVQKEFKEIYDNVFFIK